MYVCVCIFLGWITKVVRVTWADVSNLVEKKTKEKVNHADDDNDNGMVASEGWQIVSEPRPENQSKVT